MFGSNFQAYDRRLQQPLATVCALYKTYEKFLVVHSKYAPNDYIVLRDQPNVHTVDRLQQLTESDGELWKRLRCVKIQLKWSYQAILDSIETNDDVVPSSTFRHDFDLMGTCYAIHLCTEQVLLSFATLFEVSVVRTVRRQKKKTSSRPRSPSPSPEKEFRAPSPSSLARRKTSPSRSPSPSPSPSPSRKTTTITTTATVRKAFDVICDDLYSNGCLDEGIRDTLMELWVWSSQSTTLLLRDGLTQSFAEALLQCVEDLLVVAKVYYSFIRVDMDEVSLCHYERGQRLGVVQGDSKLRLMPSSQQTQLPQPSTPHSSTPKWYRHIHSHTQQVQQHQLHHNMSDDRIGGNEEDEDGSLSLVGASQRMYLLSGSLEDDMVDPYYSELLGGGSKVMLYESPGGFYSSGMTPDGSGIRGGGITGGDGVFNGGVGGLHVTPRLLTQEDSAVCLRMSIRGTYVSHSTREERHGRPAFVQASSRIRHDPANQIHLEKAIMLGSGNIYGFSPGGSSLRSSSGRSRYFRDGDLVYCHLPYSGMTDQGRYMNASMSTLSGDRDIVKAEHVSDRYFDATRRETLFVIKKVCHAVS